MKEGRKEAPRAFDPCEQRFATHQNFHDFKRARQIRRRLPSSSATATEARVRSASLLLFHNVTRLSTIPCALPSYSNSQRCMQLRSSITLFFPAKLPRFVLLVGPQPATLSNMQRDLTICSSTVCSTMHLAEFCCGTWVQLTDRLPARGLNGNRTAYHKHGGRARPWCSGHSAEHGQHCYRTKVRSYTCRI